MPTSHLHQVVDIMELILFTEPLSILDVGVGFGKYGFLSREYLELWDGKQKYGKFKVRIDGIEIQRSYLTPVHKFIYDNIYIGDAQNILSNLKVDYDLILLIDILEHFEYDQGIALLKKCVKLGRNIVIATPQNIGKQENVFDNPFERHKCQWNKKDFRSFTDICFMANKLSLVCYIGDKASRLKRARVNRKIGRFFPFSIPIGRQIKSYLNKQ